MDIFDRLAPHSDQLNSCAQVFQRSLRSVQRANLDTELLTEGKELYDLIVNSSDTVPQFRELVSNSIEASTKFLERWSTHREKDEYGPVLNAVEPLLRELVKLNDTLEEVTDSELAMFVYDYKHGRIKRTRPPEEGGVSRERGHLLTIQMREMRPLLEGFQAALADTGQLGLDSQFIAEAKILIERLAGAPGSGAVTAIKDAPADLEEVRQFEQRWERFWTQDGYQPVLWAVYQIRDALEDMNRTISNLSPSQLADIRRHAAIGRRMMEQAPEEWSSGLYYIGLIALLFLVLAAIVFRYFSN